MSNIFRRCPSGRISSNDLIDKNPIVNEFFEAGGAPTYFGILKRWAGSVWIKEPLKIFLGTWQTKPLKRWDGSAWKEIDITGV